MTHKQKNSLGVFSVFKNEDYNHSKANINYKSIIIMQNKLRIKNSIWFFVLQTIFFNHNKQLKCHVNCLFLHTHIEITVNATNRKRIMIDNIKD